MKNSGGMKKRDRKYIGHIKKERKKRDGLRVERGRAFERRNVREKWHTGMSFTMFSINLPILAMLKTFLTIVIFHRT